MNPTINDSPAIKQRNVTDDRTIIQPDIQLQPEQHGITID